MAQIDTNMGWSAADGWLTNAAGVHMGDLGIVGGPLFPNQPLATNVTTQTDCLTQGIHVDTRINGTGGTTFAAANDYPVLIYAVQTSTTEYAYRAIATSNQAKVCWVSGSNWNPSTPAANQWSYDSVTGLYYYASFTTHSTRYYTFNNTIPVFADDRTALDAVSISTTPLYKLNPNYAVACLINWTGVDGTYWTPVLISTDMTATAISSDQSAVIPGIQTDSFLYNGRRFLMSYVRGIAGTPQSPIVNILDMAGPLMSAEEVFRGIAGPSYANILVTTVPDPYEDESGSSEEEGGGGEDPEDDPVEEELLPMPSVAGHGFCTIYIPTSAELEAMANYLWSGNFDVSQVLKLFSNPMDSILGLSAVPLTLYGVDPPDQIYLGGVPVGSVTMHRYGGRTAVKVDMGTTTITERYGAYLDYDPYTEFSIYLPFIGIKPIKADDIMGKTLSLMYHIDILSGGCIAYLRPVGGSVLYEWSGQCAVQIPVTGRSFDNVFQSAMSLLTAAGAAITAPAAAPVLTGAVASAAVQAVASKPRVERSGAMNGITGFLGQQRPYIIRTTPEAYIPADQNKFVGYPAYITLNLSSLTGYNEVASIHLEGIPATADELSEIETILKEGVIF